MNEQENHLLLRPSRSNSTTTPSPREYRSKIELLHRWRRFDCHNELLVSQRYEERTKDAFREVKYSKTHWVVTLIPSPMLAVPCLPLVV